MGFNLRKESVDTVLPVDSPAVSPAVPGTLDQVFVHSPVAVFRSKEDCIVSPGYTGSQVSLFPVLVVHIVLYLAVVSSHSSGCIIVSWAPAVSPKANTNSQQYSVKKYH